MTYDNWKATNPADDELGPDSAPCKWMEGECFGEHWPCCHCGAESSPCRWDEQEELRFR